MSQDISFRIREAEEADIPQILYLVKELSEYERLRHTVTASEELYRKNGFGPERFFRALLAENTGSEGPQNFGFALYFFSFSTFTGKPSLYLEDLFVLPEYRGSGIGKRLLVELARIAHRKDCGRMEWSVLDWNEPAIRFYKSLGAKPMDEWTVFRLTEPEIKELAGV